MAHSLTTIGVHLEYAIQAEMVVELELALIERKQSRRFWHNSIIMPERYERVRVVWHCAKVKGYAELKIENPRVKTLSYDFPKLHHFNPSSFRGNVHLCQFKKKSRVQQICRNRHFY